jgi:protein involved in sex pheromone biosynthesis
MRNIVLALLASMILLAGCAPRFQDGDLSVNADADLSVQPVDTDLTIVRR